MGLKRARKGPLRLLVALVATAVFIAIYFARRAGFETRFGQPSFGSIRTFDTNSSRAERATILSCAELLVTVFNATTFVHELKLPADGAYRSRPGHWFHFSEYHVPMHAVLRKTNMLPKGQDFKTVVLRVPRNTWIEDMNPMTRLYLAAAYSDGDANNIVFVPPEAVSIESDRALFADAHSRTRPWLISTLQSLQNRFVMDAFEDCSLEQLSEVHISRKDCDYSLGKSNSTQSLGAHKIPIYSWFSEPDKTDSFRLSIQKLCALSDSYTESTATNLPVTLAEARCLLSYSSITKQAVIYQRDRTRKFMHFDEMKERVAEILGDQWEVSVIMHNDNNPPCMIVSCLSRADLLITPHGFQSMLNMFLPQNSYMVEIFPTRYYWSGYKSLGLAWGVQHAWVQSAPLTTLAFSLAWLTTTDFCMQIFYCRYLARKGNVLIDEKGFEKIQRIKARIENKQLSTTFVLSGVHDDKNCLRECGHDSKCSSYSFTKMKQVSSPTCVLHKDPFQGENGNDRVGTGVNNKRCWSPGCKR